MVVWSLSSTLSLFHSRFLFFGFASTVLLLNDVSAQHSNGTGLCSCSPGFMTFTLDFGQNCSFSTIDPETRPGIAEIACEENNFENENPDNTDFIPVRVTKIQVAELDQSQAILSFTNDEGSFVNGYTFNYTSITVSDPDSVENSPVAGLQMTLDAVNVNEEKIFNQWIILFTNQCEIFPLFVNGDEIGWSIFVDSTLPTNQFCPGQPTESPTFSPTMSNIPTTFPSFSPTTIPSYEPSLTPTVAPTTPNPNTDPTFSPSMQPSNSPVTPTSPTPTTRSPSVSPSTDFPTYSPTSSCPPVVPSKGGGKKSSKSPSPKAPKGGKSSKSPKSSKSSKAPKGGKSSKAPKEGKSSSSKAPKGGKSSKAPKEGKSSSSKAPKEGKSGKSSKSSSTKAPKEGKSGKSSKTKSPTIYHKKEKDDDFNRGYKLTRTSFIRDLSTASPKGAKKSTSSPKASKSAKSAKSGGKKSLSPETPAPFLCPEPTTPGPVHTDKKPKSGKSGSMEKLPKSSKSKSSKAPKGSSSKSPSTKSSKSSKSSKSTKSPDSGKGSTKGASTKSPGAGKGSTKSPSTYLYHTTASQQSATTTASPYTTPLAGKRKLVVA